MVLLFFTFVMGLLFIFQCSVSMLIFQNKQILSEKLSVKMANWRHAVRGRNAQEQLPRRPESTLLPLILFGGKCCDGITSFYEEKLSCLKEHQSLVPLFSLVFFVTSFADLVLGNILHDFFLVYSLPIIHYRGYHIILQRYLHKYITLAHKHTQTATRWMPKRPNGDKHKRYYLHLWKTPRHTCWLRWSCRRRLCCEREWGRSTVGDGSYTRYQTVKIAPNSGSERLFNRVANLVFSKSLLFNVPWYWPWGCIVSHKVTW